MTEASIPDNVRTAVTRAGAARGAAIMRVGVGQGPALLPERV